MEVGVHDGQIFPTALKFPILLHCFILPAVAWLLSDLPALDSQPNAQFIMWLYVCSRAPASSTEVDVFNNVPTPLTCSMKKNGQPYEAEVLDDIVHGVMPPEIQQLVGWVPCTQCALQRNSLLSCLSILDGIVYGVLLHAIQHWWVFLPAQIFLWFCTLHGFMLGNTCSAAKVLK
eukprot:scaffold204547_cov19-Tisochrysis_lutea.AAC.1